MNEFQRSAIEGREEQFLTIDGCQPDKAGKSAIWIYGIEPGNSLADQAHRTNAASGYSVEQQLNWPFNRGAFRLLTVINGQPQDSYRDFAMKTKIFEDDSNSPYVKANLYPIGARKLKTWDQSHINATGFATKSEYYAWCHEHVFPVHRTLITEYQPKLVYAAGFSNLDMFREAFSPASGVQEIHSQMSNGQIKKFFILKDSSVPVVVGPHFIGVHGLNSYEAIEAAAVLCLSLLEVESKENIGKVSAF